MGAGHRRRDEARRVHRARFRRQAIFRSGLVALAVQTVHAKLPLDRGVVGRSDAERAGDHPRPRGGSRLHDARADRRGLAEQHPLAEPCDSRAGRRRKAASTSSAGRPTGLDDCRPHALRQAARRGGGVRGRAERGGHARQGRLSQRPDGADPVRADDRQGVSRADSDHSRLDYEILHSRSQAAELAWRAGSSSAATPCSWCRGRTPTRATAT